MRSDIVAAVAFQAPKRKKLKWPLGNILAGVSGKVCCLSSQETDDDVHYRVWWLGKIFAVGFLLWQRLADIALRPCPSPAPFHPALASALRGFDFVRCGRSLAHSLDALGLGLGLEILNVDLQDLLL